MSLIMDALQKHGRARVGQSKPPRHFFRNSREGTVAAVEKNDSPSAWKNFAASAISESIPGSLKSQIVPQVIAETALEKAQNRHQDQELKPKTSSISLMERIRLQREIAIPEELAAGHVILRSAVPTKKPNGTTNPICAPGRQGSATTAKIVTAKESSRHFGRWMAWGSTGCAAMAITLGSIFYGQRVTARNSAVQLAQSNAVRAQELQKIVANKPLPMGPSVAPAPLPEGMTPAAPLLAAKTEQTQREEGAIAAEDLRPLESEKNSPVNAAASFSKPIKPSGNVAKTLQESITALDIRGIQIAPSHSRAIINNRLVQQGEEFHCENCLLTFRGIENSMLIFQDDSGMTYSRHLRQRNSRSHAPNNL